jgi:fibro-slime domain-containing protein
MQEIKREAWPPGRALTLEEWTGRAPMNRTDLVCAVILGALATACSSGGPPTEFSGDASTGGAPPANDASTPQLGLDASLRSPDGGGGVPATLTATVRDFRLYDGGDPSTDPDFENPPFDIGQDGGLSPGYTGSWYDTEIVADTLGSDGTPVYKNPGATTLTTHGASAFQSWFHDAPGTNVHVEYPLPITPKGNGVYGYDSETDGVPYNLPGGTGDGFFPIDDGSPYATPFGDQGLPHNYSFTMELHTVFTYAGGEYFQFRGDDDVFVFIDKKLVINLGGVHDPEPAQVSVDTLGLTLGGTYPLDFFSAERHVYGSNIEFTTTLALQLPPK